MFIKTPSKHHSQIKLSFQLPQLIEYLIKHNRSNSEGTCKMNKMVF